MDKIELRDFFAGKVLGAIQSSPSMWNAICADKHKYSRNETDTLQDFVAQECYKMADAMLKERDFKGDGVEPIKDEDIFNFEILVDGVDEWKGGSFARTK